MRSFDLIFTINGIISGDDPSDRPAGLIDACGDEELVTTQ